MNQSSNVEDSLEPMTVDAITVSGLTTQVVGEVIMHLIRHIDINQFKTCRHTELTLFLEYRDDPPRVIASGDIGYKHRVVRRLYAGKEK